jgi:hypothetical protein
MFSRVYNILDTNYRQSNNMEVLLDINVLDGVVAVPQSLLGYEAREDSAQSGVYGIGACALATVPEIQLAFRLCGDFLGESSVSLWTKCLALTSDRLRDECQHLFRQIAVFA